MTRPYLALGAVALLAACAQTPPPPPGPVARVFATDQQGGVRRCEVQVPVLTTDKANEARMLMANEGGWCGLPVARPGPQPYAAGLLTARPAHGKVAIRTVGDATRLAYTPDSGFTGADVFTVKLVPEMTELRVAVTVEPGPPTAVAAAPAPATAVRTVAAPAVAPRRPAARATPARNSP